MKNSHWNSYGSFGLPNDLRSWVNEDSLVRLVFHALHSVQEDANWNQTAGRVRLPAGAPRTFLLLLTYSYAIGLCGSDEIESRVPIDPQLRYLAAKTTPSSGELRQFRRHHRAFVRQCLAQLLRLGCQSHFAFQTLGLNPEEGMVSLDFFEAEAEARIDQAVLADTMALDN